MRPLPVVLGVLVLLAVWGGLPREFVPGPFSAHMTMHMGVVAVACPLLALGVAGRALDPVRRAPALLAPVPASIVELVVVWAWHAPALHHAASHSVAARVAEQATFLASGLLVWVAALGGDARRRQQRTGAGILALLLTSMHMTLLGALLALPPRPLYEHPVPVHDAPAHGAGRSLLSPLEDQHLGGAIMLVAGGTSYLCGGLWLTVRLLREGRPAMAPRPDGLPLPAPQPHAEGAT